jgi:pimeloyl-ACP methyl ester carboxylesterase
MNWITLLTRRLQRPYRLAKVVDRGAGQPIVLLHGIGRSSNVWRYLLTEMQSVPSRMVAFDLLGFGASPKPDSIEYTVDDQATAVIAAIKRLRSKQPVLIVGHSMGCLVAVRVARLRPDLVQHLVLYEMPLYDGLPDKRKYQTRIAIYYKFYEWGLKQHPTFGEAKTHFSERIASKVMGSELTAATWEPFKKSLKNTIMKQTAATDLKHLAMPADVIYGSRDMFVIRGKVTEAFGLESSHITTHVIKERHVISAKAASFIAARIIAALKRNE